MRITMKYLKPRGGLSKLRYVCSPHGLIRKTICCSLKVRTHGSNYGVINTYNTNTLRLTVCEKLTIPLYQLLKCAVVILQVIRLNTGNYSHFRIIPQITAVTFISLCNNKFTLTVFSTWSEGGKVSSDQNGWIEPFIL